MIREIAVAIPLMQRSEIESLLATLRLDADMAWVNHFREHVWMKPLVRDGRRIGITECCDFDVPCERHTALTPADPSARNAAMDDRRDHWADGMDAPAKPSAE